ncbi:hypothetical protein [Reinekea sp. G2M2-21]|uniref:hypothetical protein n=1 Tax=Reinekea sp. G2M2-21 TaxID=2788942 RepID=UPI001E4C9008|nr:hypothetical protein [Reinekea sp. G2M2-21]
MNRKSAFLTLIAISLVTAFSVTHAAGNPPLKRNDPNRPVDKIAADLNIEEDEFIECFWNVNPAPGGTQPSKEREEANKAILLPCLQAANPDITNDYLDEVMGRYRP